MNGDNLNSKQAPIFQSVFGKDWDDLPPVMKKHYANHPFTSEVNTIQGTLDVFCKPPLLWLAPLMRLLGQIPAFNEDNVPVTVRFESDPDSNAFHFNRRFSFSDRKPYVFRSLLYQVEGNEVIEKMKFGIGWKAQFSWDGEKVILAHKGYALHVLRLLIPVPLTFIFGAGNAVEYPVDENTFDMEVSITHPLWGEMYGYKGRFEVIT